MERTKPFKVGRTYLTQEGKRVRCISVTTLPGYECAQFNDRETPEGGYRYNRESDRGRVTGSNFDMSDPRNVIPEERAYVGVMKGATAWEWQVGRLFGRVNFPRFWFLKGRMMDGSRRSSFFSISWDRGDAATEHKTLWSL